MVNAHIEQAPCDVDTRTQSHKFVLKQVECIFIGVVVIRICYMVAQVSRHYQIANGDKL